MNRIKEILTSDGARRLARVLTKSLLPGACLSLLMFVHAFIHDADYHRYRESTPDVDLSGIRIDNKSLGENEPFLEISSYPNRPEYSFIENPGEETWQALTLNGEPIPDYETLLKALGGYDYNLWVLGTRSQSSHHVFIDRPHNLELRFYQNHFGKVRLMRIDRRNTLAFLARRDPNIYDDAETDYGQMYGPRLFYDWEADGLLHKIAAIIKDYRFLFYLREYLYIPIYGAAWLFPLLWAMEKKKARWFAALALWYPLWYIFCSLTLAARQ